MQVERFNGNKMICEKKPHKHEDTSSCNSLNVMDNSVRFKLKMGKKTKSNMSISTVTTYASTDVSDSESSSDLPLVSKESLTSSIIFANRCLLQSYERRSKRNLIMPSSLSHKSQMVSDNVSMKTLIPPLSVTHNSLIKTRTTEELGGRIPPSTYTGMPPLSPRTKGRIDASTRSVKELLNDVSRSSSEEKEIKIKLMLTKAIIYRQKCARSKNKLLLQYNNLADNSDIKNDCDCDHSPTCNTLPKSSKNNKHGSVVSAMWKQTANLLLSRIDTLFILYADSLSHIIDKL